MEGGRGRRIARASFSAAITLAILYYLGRNLARSWRQAGVYDWSVSWGWVAVSAVLLAIYFYLAAWLWKRLVGQLGEKIGTRAACRVWFLSQMGKYVPGKIWFALGRVYLGRQAGVSGLAASVSTLLELMLVILAAFGVFLLSLPLWPSVGKTEGIAAPVAIVLLLLCVHPRVFGPMLRVALRVLRRPPVEYRFSWGGLLLIGAGYGLTWLVYGAGLEVLTRAIRLEGIDGSPPLAVAPRILFFSGAAGVAWAVGFLSIITPSGLGVREATLGYLLAGHLAPPLPILLALVARIWITFGEIGAALVGWRVGRPRNES